MSGSKRPSGTGNKCKRVLTNASSTSLTNASGITTGSKSTSMWSAGFVSMNGKSSLDDDEQEGDDT
jgi:hypothetical protein